MKLRLITRAGRVGLLMSIALAPYPLAFAAAAQTRHHYEITGGLTPSADATAGSVPTHFGAIAPHVTQAGDRFELSARLAEIPYGCAADTIFSNGFDP